MAPLRAFAAVWLVATSALHACQVPVFRYALERWAPAEYILTVTPGSAGLSNVEKQLVERLQAAQAARPNPANVRVQVAPAASTAGPASIALGYPPRIGAPEKPPIWQAPLLEENANRLLESPLRTELRKRLLAGESAVWVLVESGDRARDDAAHATLEKAITAAESSLKLPDGVITPAQATAANGRSPGKENADVLRSDLPLRIDFSTVRVRRDDPNEAALIAMLIHLEDDLIDYDGEPMVFPVFGRGRVLEPLIGGGIHQDNVMEHSGYLCGACSCEVKEQNPGMDLLMDANWNPVDTTPKLEIVHIAPDPEPALADAAGAPRPAASRIALGAGAVLLAAASWAFARKRKQLE